MTKNKIKTIPNFKSIKQEAEFWDNHDFTDFSIQTSTLARLWLIEKLKKLTPPYRSI